MLDAGSQTSGDSYIGYLGDGVVNIMGGATFDSSRVFVGRFGIRNLLKGELNVDDSGSNWSRKISPGCFSCTRPGSL